MPVVGENPFVISSNPFLPPHAGNAVPAFGHSRSDQMQAAFWPGLLRVAAFNYTCVHGIQPCSAELVVYPQPDARIQLPPMVDSNLQPLPPVSAAAGPASFGDLTMTDGFRTITLRDCKLDKVDAMYTTAEGTVYSVKILDRRWRWRNQFGGLGGIDGFYNQTDTREKLVPWSIRSPEELAKLIFKEMGELNYVIELPQGITKAMGANIDRFLRLGENFMASRTNPKTEWNKTPPAEALAWLADRFGCRVVYQPTTDRVLLVPQGRPFPNRGTPALPDYPFEMIAPGVDVPETPEGVGAAGMPLKVQVRLCIEPVAEEWDGSHLFIDDVSYAPPAGDGAQCEWAIDFTKTDDTRVQDLSITVTYDNGDTFGFISTDRPFSLSQRFTDLIQKGNAAGGNFTVFTSGGSQLRIKGNDNKNFTVTILCMNMDTVIDPNNNDPWTVHQVTKGKEGGRGWHTSQGSPPHFYGAQATDRLAHIEARGLAQKSVFKKFRVVNKDPATRKEPLTVPAFGKLKRINQIIVLNAKVEQVVPTPRIAGGRDKGNPINVNDMNELLNAGVLPEFYNGRSRDRKATCTGSIWKRIGSVYWYPTIQKGDDKHNTKPEQRVFVDFDIDTDANGDQIVTFSDYVYGMEYPDNSIAFIKYPELTLEAAVLCIHEDTNHIIRWTKTLDIEGGSAPIEWHHHDDLQVGIIGEYDGAPTAPGTLNPAALPQSTFITWNGIDRSRVQDLTVTLQLGALSVTIADTFTIRTLAGRWASLIATANADASFTTNWTIGLVGTDKVEIKAKLNTVGFTAAASTINDDPGADLNPWGAYTANQMTGAGVPAGKPAVINTLTGWHYAPGDLEHSNAAADDYLAAHARKYIEVDSEVRRFIGIYRINLDGATQSATWSGGEGGPTTIASLNDEYSHVIPPYPVRRRPELLPPDKAASAANAAERDWLQRNLPRAGGAVS